MTHLAPNGVNLDDVEALLRDHEATGVSRALALDLITRIRELEAAHITQVTVEMKIKFWEASDHHNPLARTWELRGHDGIVRWHYDNGADGGEGDSGEAVNVRQALLAMYESMLQRGEVTE